MKKYQELSNISIPTKIYLIFNEIVITKKHQNHGDYEYPNKKLYKKYRHADGSPNLPEGSYPAFGIWKDKDSNNAPLILPPLEYTPLGASYNRSHILDNVQKYFEIFDIEVLEAATLPEKWGRPSWFLDPQTFEKIGMVNNSHPRYVKILPPELYVSHPQFLQLPEKYYPYKRLAWWQEKEPNPAMDCAVPWNNFASVGYRMTSQDSLIAAIVHEIGHLYGLHHQGDQRADASTSEGQYYGANPGWSPIMGYVFDILKFIHWSNTDYKKGIVRSRTGHKKFTSENELVKMLNSGAKLLKLPGYRIESTPPGSGFAPRGHRGKPLKGKNREDTLYARYATSNELIGMIGFENDYDIIKVLVPKGYSQFFVKAYKNGSEDRSPLDPRIEILYCQSDIKGSAVRPTIAYTDVWIPNKNDISDLKNKNIFHQIVIDNDGFTSEPKNIHSVGTSSKDSDFYSSFVGLTTQYTTLVYLKIMGNWSGSVDPLSKKPLVVDEGYSNFGSTGKYILKFYGEAYTAKIKEENYPIPYGRFEEFQYCKNGNYEKVWLCVQSFYDDGDGDPSKETIWVLETDVITNSKLEKKRFLVYGQPLDINAPEEDGKFYLPVVVDGDCKKQEFIVGMPRPEEES